MKLSFEEIVDMVKISNLETEDESKIIANVQKLIAEKEAEKEEKEGEEKPKFVPVGIVNLESIQPQSNDGLGYILMIREDDDVGEVPFKVAEAIRAFNESKKGRKCPVKSFAEACANVSAKYWKQVGLKVKTKESIYFQSTENLVIPEL